MWFTVRTDQEPTSVAASVSMAVRRQDRDLRVEQVATLEQRLADTIARPKAYAVFLAVFASVALVLAMIGIYGVIAYEVTQRIQEIGIRMALGANARQVIVLVMKHAATMTAVGLGVGLAGAVASTRILTSLLFGLSPQDPVTFAAIPALFAIVALCASYLPARRATKVDPLIALRNE